MIFKNLSELSGRCTVTSNDNSILSVHKASYKMSENGIVFLASSQDFDEFAKVFALE